MQRRHSRSSLVHGGDGASFTKESDMSYGGIDSGTGFIGDGGTNSCGDSGTQI